MKQPYLLLVCLSFCQLIQAQQIQVKSFRKLDTDLTARGQEKRMDQNGDLCAIIKIVTTETGFVFEPDALGLVGSLKKTGEIWLYVPYGAKKITIKHDKLGVLRDYLYPERIEKACVYELVLMTGRLKTIVEEEINGQWLIVNTNPTDAVVYIDDVYESGMDGSVQKFVIPGKHTYRIEHPMYHAETGQVDVTIEQKKELTVKLNPAFGYISVNSLPENEADVYINDEKVGVTPYKSNRLKSGKHRVRILKSMFQPTESVVTVTDGQTTPVNIQLKANFAEINFITADNAEIWINNQRKGMGSWKGRLNAGMYIVEVRQLAHRTIKQSIEFKPGEQKNIQLGKPTPIYGALNISSNPVGVSVKLNGKEYGTTPVLLKKLLIGNYSLDLSKPGYNSLTKMVEIKEGKMEEINFNLTYEKEITFKTSVKDADLYVNDKLIGIAPKTVKLKLGKHCIKVVKGTESVEEKIEVTENSPTEYTLRLSLHELREKEFETDLSAKKNYYSESYEYPVSLLNEYEAASVKNKGNAAWKAKNYKKAFEQFETYIKGVAYKDFAYIYNTAVAASKIKNYAAAEKYFDKSIKNKYKTCSSYLGKVKAMEQQNNIEGMLSTLQEGISVCPDNTKLETMYGSYCLKQGKYFQEIGNVVKAAENYSKITNLTDKSYKVQGFFSLAVLFFNKGAKILQDATPVANIDRAKYDIEKTKAMNDFNKAKYYLTQAQNIDPSNQDVKYLMRQIDTAIK